MPEAPVDEYRHPLLSKNKIRPSEKSRVTAPPDETVRAEQFDQTHFRELIAAALNPRHDLGTLLRRENVRH